MAQFETPVRYDRPPDMHSELAAIAASASILSDALVQNWYRPDASLDKMLTVIKPYYPGLLPGGLHDGRMWDIVIVQQAVEWRALDECPAGVKISLPNTPDSYYWITDPAWRAAFLAAQYAAVDVLGLSSNDSHEHRASQRWAELVASLGE